MSTPDTRKRDIQLESLENDSTPLSDIGVHGMVRDVLTDADITRVSDLVAEFQKDEPFENVMGIGAVKSAGLRQLLLEHKARRSNPKSLVRFLLRGPRVINYVMIPSIVAIVLLAAARVGYTKGFDRDDWTTLAVVFISLIVFELGHWSCDPTLVRRPWTVGRTRIFAVLISLAATRIAVSGDYGWTEGILYVITGSLLGAMDGAITWARREAIRDDEPIRTADRAAAGHLFEALVARAAKVHHLVWVALISGMFGLIATIIAMAQAIIVETIKNWDKLAN